MELKDTIEMMSSEDYKERFKAEYHQTKIRREKLRTYITQIDAYEAVKLLPNVKKPPEPKHDCPVSMLKQQLSAMDSYLHAMEMRAIVEGIEL